MRRFVRKGFLEATGVQLASYAALATLFVGLLGCGGATESQVDEDTEGYPLVGEILEVRSAEGVMKVAHEDIPDFMPAMTMDFEVREGDLKTFKPGMKIRARLVRGEEGEFILKKIWPLGDGKVEKAIRAAAEEQAERMEKLGSGRYLGAGDDAPNVVLMDQFGEVIDVSALKGKFVMLNFIFTRCSDANMCPLSTSKMARMQRLAKEKGLDDLYFVSVTMDPLYDTPGVLREFADLYSIDGSNFKFATGPKSAVNGLFKALAVTVIPKKEQDDIAHSLATTLIGPDGKILLRSEKSAWKVEDFMALVEK